MNIYVVQHCQSEHHINGMSGGWTDTPLTKLGIEQARKVACYLKEIVVGETQIYSSDLLRASETADEISKELGIEVTLETGLRERCFGIATNMPKEWLEERIKPLPLDNSIDFEPIEGAETWRSFHRRVSKTMDNIYNPNVDNIIIVTHGGAKNNVIAWWLSMPVESLGKASFFGCPGAVTTLVSNNGFNVLKFLSDTRHLN